MTLSEVESKAKSALLAEEGKAKGLWATYRLPIIVGAVALILGVVLGHLL